MRFLRLFVPVVLFAASATAQTPSMTSITPGYGGSNGGSVSIVGTNFVPQSTAIKGMRFVDNNNVDIINASCSSTTDCSGSVRPGLVAPGQVLTFAVFALNAATGAKSGSFSNLVYYGAPLVTLSPSSGPQTGSSITVNGGPLTSGAAFPGVTTFIPYGTPSDRGNDTLGGCASTSQCLNVATNNPMSDCCVSAGARPLTVITPGGADGSKYFLYGTTPATPTITSITPSKCVPAGGCTVTIVGTNFLTGSSNVPGDPLRPATQFSFSGLLGFGGGPATSVSCSSSTTCTAVVPSGFGLGGPSDVEATTLCEENTACAGTRAASSIPGRKTNAFNYSGIKVDPGINSNLKTSENGGTAQFRVSLYTQPSANVTVNLTHTTGRATLSVPSFSFTTSNWNTPQTVTVTGRDDTGVGGAAMPGTGNYGYGVAITGTSSDLAYNGINGADQNFTNLDNDTSNVFITPVSGLVTTEPGGTATFTVVLTKAPSATMTVHLVSNDPTEGTASPATLTFLTSAGGPTGWNVPRTVTITPVNDGVVDGEVPYSIITRITGGDATYTGTYLDDVSVLSKETGAPAPVAPAIKCDYNGDFRSDVITQNSSSGDVAQWQLNAAGLSIAAGAVLASPGASWKVVAAGDFNHDTKADLLLQNSATGEIAEWHLNGFGITMGGLVASPGVAWKAITTGDFTADGFADIVLQNTGSNDIALWQMNGFNIITPILLGNPGGAYKAVATGDFNADTRSDIVLQDSSNGNVAIWSLNSAGTAIQTGVALGGSGVAWKVMGTGDFNSDLRSDIGLQNTSSGEIAVWTLNAGGTAISTGASLGGSGVAWKFVGTGDVDADLKSDIVIQNTSTGDVAIWKLNGPGTAISAGAVLGGSGSAWVAMMN